ncbi:MAG: redoxin domain-containing protein [Caldilineaceae bacterium]|nr:redoxin domain-containing protein [Caldilineaceae bacterium]
MKRWLIVAVLILIFGSGWLWYTRPEGGIVVAGLAAQPAVGRPAPDFELPTLDGGTFRLSEYRDRPVVLNFWATWCQPCQRELPAIQRAAEHYAGVVTFAAVDQAETDQRVQRYVDDLGLTFIIPMDGKQEVGERYDITGLPTTFFIDEKGVIQAIWMGEMNSITLAENIAVLLK